MKGSYVLIIENKKDQTIQVGKLGKIFFKKGFYAYVGSALNGLEQRINRHLRVNKKIHWHIDYLLSKTKVVDIFFIENKIKEECKIADNFKQKLKFIPKFGCSDCNCNSHLFYGSYKDISSCSRSSNLLLYTNF